MTGSRQSNGRLRRAHWAAPLALAVLALPGAALAQDADAEADGDNGDIVVTATRTPTSVERLPARIEIIDREEIEARGYVSVVDALRETPGIIAVQNGTPGSLTSVFSRGTNSKHTLALYDGIRLNDASAPNAQFNFGQDLLGDLQRVEVLRGAASSIYGSDAIGGVVNLIPRRGADGMFEPYYEASLGSFETARGLFGAAGTIGALAYGVTVEGLTTEGFDQVPDRFALNNGVADGANIATVSANARYDVSAAFAIDALFRIRDADSEFDTFSGGPSFSLRADDPDLAVDKDRYTVWRLGADANFGALQSRLSGGQVTNEREERNGDVRTSAAEGERTFVDFINTWTPADIGTLNQIAVSFGASWMDEEIDVAATAFSGRLARSEGSSGVFLVAQSGLGEYFDVTGSVRLDDNENFGDHTTYNVGFVHDLGWLGAPVRLLAAYGTSFKAPTLNERFSVSAFNLGNPNLKPEEGEGFEIGFDADFLERDHGPMLGFGFTWFDNEISNLIEYNFSQLRNINIGRVEIEGYETYLDFNPVDWIDLRLTRTYTETVNAVLPTRPQLLRRPEHLWGLQLDVQPVERLSVALTWNWVASRNDVNYSNAGAFVSSGRRIGGYNLGSVTATVEANEHAEVFASLQNVLNEEYEQPEAFAGAPRAIYVGVRGRF